MTHNQLEWALDLMFFVWVPICFIIFIYLIFRIFKRIAQKPWFKQSTLKDKNKITLYCLWYFLPVLATLIVLLIPVFYFNHLSKQEDYCLTVVRSNRITDPNTDNAFLHQRCGDFDLPELISRAYQQN
ncbi:hypothetical protein RCS94_06775 [Orbaceae bacterium ac157xtp]